MQILAYVSTVLLVLVTMLAVLITIVGILVYVVGRPTAAIWVPWLVTGLAEGRFAPPPPNKPDKRRWYERLFGLVANRRNWGFTGIREGYAKLVLTTSGKRVKVLMNYEHFGFHKNWTLVRTKPESEKQVKVWKENPNGDGELSDESVEILAPDDERTTKDPGGEEEGAKKFALGDLYSWLPPWFSTNFPKGFYWVGNPWKYKIDERWFRWKSLRQKNKNVKVSNEPNEEGEYIDSIEETAAGDIVSRRKFVDDILLQTDNYPIYVKGADTGEGESFQVDAVFIATVRIVNPMLALTRVQEWFEMFDNRMMGVCRHWISINPYEIGKQMAEGTSRHTDMPDDKADPVMKSAVKTIERLEGHYGIRVQDISLPSFELTSDPALKDLVREQYRALNAKRIAEGDKTKVEIAAVAEAKRINTVTDADAERIKKLAAARAEGIRMVAEAARAQGDLGGTLIAADAVRDLAGGENTTIVTPGFDALLKSIVGNRPKQLPQSTDKEGDK